MILLIYMEGYKIYGGFLKIFIEPYIDGNTPYIFHLLFIDVITLLLLLYLFIYIYLIRCMEGMEGMEGIL
jgi:hypothetical protein